MKNLTIKIQVKGKIEAWKIVTRLGYEHEVKEATFENKTHKFDQTNKTKDFLREEKQDE